VVGAVCAGDFIFAVGAVFSAGHELWVAVYFVGRVRGLDDPGAPGFEDDACTEF